MKKSGSRWFALLSLAAGLSASFSASADWTFGGATSGGPAYTSIAGSPASDPSLTISGAYAANGGTLTSGASGTSIVAGNSYGISGFANAATWTVNSSSTLQYYGGNGLGMSSDSTLTQAPNHALDNGVSTNSSDKIDGLGNTEAVMLSFGSSVVLSSVGIGYTYSGDADVSVFRYIGSNTVAPALNGTKASLTDMQNAGWQLVGNYGDFVYDNSTPYNLVNADNLGSSWWLISAYNSSYGAATAGRGSVDQGNDFFKIYAVAGAKCVSTGGGSNCGAGPSGSKIPEPGSLALVSVGLVGALGLRRRSLASRA
jgi:hypothetical protein